MTEMIGRQVETVHLVFKTHLDIGFTDYAANVKRQYMESYIPAAMRVARQLRERGGHERFVWTTGSWLIYEYLETAAPAQRAEMEQAIAAGDIAWHGLPCTFHSEMVGTALFRFGLSLSQKLDARFGKQTIAAKMTDVPGHTRGIVPLLAQAGIRFLHIGVNAASTPPDVPDAFVWQHTDGSEVIVAYDKAGYGSISHVPGMASALAIAHTNDNLGPNDPQEILDTYQKLQAQFPTAAIRAGRLDDYARDVLAVKDQLPVVTGELGDTWIHGASTDPRKIAQFRALCRLREQWLETGRAAADDARLERFSRFLLLVPEHTWGMDEKVFLDDYTHYAVDALQELRQTEKCKRFEASWAEQRAFITQAVQALGAGDLADEAQATLTELEPRQPYLGELRAVDDLGRIFETAHFQLGFDERGAIAQLRDKRTGRQWATPEHPLGLFQYETFSAADYERFVKQYVRLNPGTIAWAIKDFTKPGLENTPSAHVIVAPQKIELYHQSTPQRERFVVEMYMPDKYVQCFGCPRLALLEVECLADRATLELTLRWHTKRANRMPEALWFSFQPQVEDAQGWSMDKLGTPVSPLDVVPDGNRHLHAVQKGVAYHDERGGLQITSLDAPLVAPGRPSLLDFNNDQPVPQNGMHFNLYNNIWGTNFPMWYDEDARFRFIFNTTVNP
jgi:hypothetical protein